MMGIIVEDNDFERYLVKYRMRCNKGDDVFE